MQKRSPRRPPPHLDSPSPITTSTLSTSTTASPTTSQSSSSIAGPVAGVVGGVTILAAMVAVLVFYLRKSPRAPATYYPPTAEENPKHTWGAGLSHHDSGDDEQEKGYGGRLGNDERGETVGGRLRYDGMRRV
jgi:hypothetical protein